MMNFLKLFLVLWASSTAFVATTPAPERSDPWEVTQQYCGELLKSAVQIVCKGKTLKNTVEQFERQERNKFIINACCTKECNLKFIKAHCPEQHTKLNKATKINIPAGTTVPVLESIIKSTTTTTTTTTTTPLPPTKPPTSKQESHGLWYYMLLPLHDPFYSNFYLP